MSTYAYFVFFHITNVQENFLCNGKMKDAFHYKVVFFTKSWQTDMTICLTSKIELILPWASLPLHLFYLYLFNTGLEIIIWRSKDINYFRTLDVSISLSFNKYKPRISWTAEKEFPFLVLSPRSLSPRAASLRSVAKHPECSQLLLCTLIIWGVLLRFDAWFSARRHCNLIGMGATWTKEFLKAPQVILMYSKVGKTFVIVH